MVYEPEEDSYLLESFVEKLARGKVLDMGTGSGIQAVVAAKRNEVASVLAVDIDKEAVSLFPNAGKKVSCILSDLFSHVKGKFDTIIFNPPYLPAENGDEDLALDGGEKGHELIGRFLNEAKSHLSKDGFILLLFSNRTGKEKVDSLVKRENYSSEMLVKKSLPFFEELYIYRLSAQESSCAELFARGKRGIIYRDRNICIKEKNPESAVDTLENEAEFLKLLNKKNIGPKFISYADGQLRREFIDGEHLGKFLAAEKDRKKILSVFQQVLLQCREMDLLGINKTELTNPYKDIIVDEKNQAVLIDFERCKKTEKPKNVTQFLQYIAKNAPGLAEKKIIVDKKQLIELGRGYKSLPSEKSFRRILSFLS